MSKPTRMTGPTKAGKRHVYKAPPEPNPANLAKRAEHKVREQESILRKMEAAAQQHAVRFPGLAHLFTKRKAK
jgi:hypothetical protein